MAGLRDHIEGALAHRYAVVRELGHGATATVYLARDLKHDRLVALKVLRPELSATLGSARFLKEITLLAQLQHPHILPLYDSGEAAGVLYFTSPYVEGESLRDRLVREGRLDVRDAARVAYQVADALAYAHSRNTLHRDIKPENVLLSSGHAVLSDFGIARAISRAADDQSAHTTQAGIAVGTPAYMSPEQAMGEPSLDGRTDIYSLGCVLYEMLTGEAPFSGPTLHALIASRFTETPPSVRARRPDVPPSLDATVARALALAPGDRFAGAAELRDALLAERDSGPQATPAPAPARGEAGSGEQARRRTTVPLTAPASTGATPGAHRAPASSGGTLRRSGPWRMTGRAAAAALAAAALAAVFLDASVRATRVTPAGAMSVAGTPALDRSLYAVLPFRDLSAAPAPGALSGAEAERLLYDALARWSDVRVANDQRVSDMRARLGTTSGTLELRDAIAVAHGLGAGTLAWGDVSALGDSIEVRGVLYDVARPTASSRQYRVRIARDLSDVAAKFDELADSLLLGPERAARAGGAAPGAMNTRVLGAWRSYVQGRDALDAWDLGRAEQGFADAAARDPGYPDAHLWLAYTQSLDGRPAEQWLPEAERAAALGARLPAGDRALAAALVALGERRYPQACERYAELVRRDSLDFTGWYGLGECHALDETAVRDASSPSGWRFRADYNAALRAYRRAFAVMPSSYLAFRDTAMTRLARRFFVSAGVFRAGYAVEGDTIAFASRPYLAGDSLAFVPYPAGDVLAGRAGRPNAASAAAIRRNRALLAAVTAGWAAAFPNSVDALEAHATMLERQGALADVGQWERSAVATVRRARALGRRADPRVATRLAATDARLRLKTSDFAGARALADSLLAANASPTVEDAERLAPLALLTGHRARAVALLTRAAPDFTTVGPDGREVEVPQPLVASARALLAYASLGAPRDSVAALARRTESLLASTIAPARQRTVRRALLAKAYASAWPEGGLSPLHRSDAGTFYLLALQVAASRGDTAALRARFDSVRALRTVLAPGDVGVDALFNEARVLLVVGDTAGATSRLDAALEALGARTPEGLALVEESGAAVGAMALRAELAARARDAAAARRWAGAVSALWSGADAELQPVVARMRRIAASGAP